MNQVTVYTLFTAMSNDDPGMMSFGFLCIFLRIVDMAWETES